MSIFKDQIVNDLAVFINTDEFAELHDINGQLVPAVVDQHILSESSGSLEQAAGIYTGRLVVFIEETRLPSIPVIGQGYRVDGRLYLVKNVIPANGLLEITLEANEIL